MCQCNAAADIADIRQISYAKTAMKPLAALLTTLTLASPLAAHPHIFIDTGLDLTFDDSGQLTEVKVTWVYDEFYSLLIMEDRGLDPDFDGVLTAAEIDNLTGFDMQWTRGFNGDLVITQAGRELTLSGPLTPTASYDEGRITTTHVRHIEAVQADAEGFSIKPYDPTFYSAYDITRPVRLLGAEGCSHRIEVPDIDARMRELRTILESLDVNATPEDEGLPDIGGLLASAVIVTCDIS